MFNPARIQGRKLILDTNDYPAAINYFLDVWYINSFSKTELVGPWKVDIYSSNDTDENCSIGDANLQLWLLQRNLAE